MKKIGSKSKKILITLGLILLLVIILSISYAYLRKTVAQTDFNQINVLDCLDITFTDVTNAINLEGEYPIPDSEGMTRTPYTFKVTNNCDVYTELDINLEVLPSLGNYNNASCAGKAWLRGEGFEWTLVPHLSYSGVAWSLNDNGYVYIGNGDAGYSVRPSLYLKSNVKTLKEQVAYLIHI